VKYYPTSLEDLLEPYPPGDPKRQAFEIAYGLASSLDLPMEPQSGFGLMIVLHLARVTLQDGRVLGDDPCALSIGELGELCAVLFTQVHQHPLWWKSRYPEELANPITRATAKLITERLREFKPVKELYVPT
jgi:hypothetical protein